MALHSGGNASQLAFIRQDADYTLTSQTAAQQLFNTSTNGRVTLPAGIYRVRGLFYVTSMSATSGNADFNLLGGGGATLAHQMIAFVGRDAAMNVAAQAASIAGFFGQNGLATDIATAGTSTGLYGTLSGQFKVTAAGTIQPSIALTTASAAVVRAGSYIEFEKIAELGTNSVGAWD